jgi:molybdopterin-guanine dinucleotide biosynthesis protein A
LGQDKRFLLVRGQPLVLWVVERLRPLVDEVLLVTLEPELFSESGCRLVTDRYPGRGALAGVHAGLEAAQGEWAFVVAGDMPLLDPILLRAMQERATESDADILVPRWQGELEPLHALYRPATCTPVAEAALLRGDRRIIAFYPEVRVQIMEEEDVRRWDREGRSFFNVNTQEEWQWVLDRLSNEGSESRE